MAKNEIILYIPQGFPRFRADFGRYVHGKWLGGWFGCTYGVCTWKERGLGREGKGEPNGAMIGDTAGVAGAGVGAEGFGAAVGGVGNLQEGDV